VKHQPHERAKGDDNQAIHLTGTRRVVARREMPWMKSGTVGHTGTSSQEETLREWVSDSRIESSPRRTENPPPSGVGSVNDRVVHIGGLAPLSCTVQVGDRVGPFELFVVWRLGRGPSIQQPPSHNLDVAMVKGPCPGPTIRRSRRSNSCTSSWLKSSDLAISGDLDDFTRKSVSCHNSVL